MRLPLTFGKIRFIALQLFLVCANCALVGCAQYPDTRHKENGGGALEVWEGRIAISIASSPPQSFSASFELRGDSQTGHMTLSTPLGTTLAQMTWTAREASLLTGETEKKYTSLRELTLAAMGAELPIEAILLWLNGIPAHSEGWQSDLSAFSAGRLEAHRNAPEPRVNLKIVLNR